MYSQLPLAFPMTLRLKPAAHTNNFAIIDLGVEFGLIFEFSRDSDENWDAGALNYSVSFHKSPRIRWLDLWGAILIVSLTLAPSPPVFTKVQKMYPAQGFVFVFHSLMMIFLGARKEWDARDYYCRVQGPGTPTHSPTRHPPTPTRN